MLRCAGPAACWQPRVGHRGGDRRRIEPAFAPAAGKAERGDGAAPIGVAGSPNAAAHELNSGIS